MSGAREGSPRELDGVLFDYGDTLVEFSRPDEALAEAELRILEVLSAAGEGGLSIEGIRAVLDRVDREVAEHQRRNSWRRWTSLPCHSAHTGTPA